MQTVIQRAARSERGIASAGLVCASARKIWHQQCAGTTRVQLGNARLIAGRCRRCCGSGGVIATLAVGAVTSLMASKSNGGVVVLDHCLCEVEPPVSLSSAGADQSGGSVVTALQILAQRDPTRPASFMCLEKDPVCSP